jgi:hypothetical protein
MGGPSFQVKEMDNRTRLSAAEAAENGAFAIENQAA